MKQWLETTQVLDRLADVRRQGVRAALATVVRVRGSAYRHEGAKLLLCADGTTIGNVSGGCLEQDVREVALRVLATARPEVRRYCSSADEIAAWDLGVGCEGEVEILVEPALEARPRERELLEGRRAFAVCTPLPTGGEGEPGQRTRLIVTADGAAGTLGSRTLDDAALVAVRALLGTAPPGVHEIHGHAVFCDLFQPPPQLVLCGGGEDARPLARLAAEVGFRVVVVDRRPGLLQAERFPAPVRLVTTDAARLAERVLLDRESYAVVMGHNYADDQAFLRALVATPVPYIGVLGPRQRTERIVRTVATEGGGAQVDATRIYGPVGLDIGTDGAEQVALAVIAELLALRSGRRAASLRERAVPIHAPAD
jgi:xanthine dehydrogenase accessory factor